LRAGRRLATSALLHKHHTLHVALTVTQTQGATSTNVGEQTVTFHAKKHKKS
jgi:hypothetical protein